MIDTSDFLHRIKECTHDDTLYLLEKISDGGGFFALNGNILYMTLNNENSSNVSIRTEYLHLETNIYVSAFNTTIQSFRNGYYNFIELYMHEGEEFIEKLNAFVKLCVTYDSHADETDFTAFFDSLVTLFQLPKEQTYMNLIGLFGELTIIAYFYEQFKIDLSKYWHTSGAKSKLDFVAPNINIEVKSTLANDLIFHIKHDQLFGNSTLTYLLAVSLKENNSGITLDELANNLLSAEGYCNSIEFAINLEAEKLRVSPQDAAHKRFCLKEIRLYNANDICPFMKVPENISDLTYRINLTYLNREIIQGIVKKLE